jgi:hypothetical protein
MTEQNKQVTEHNFKLGDKLYETPKEREGLAKGEINIKDVEKYKKEVEGEDNPSVRRFLSGLSTPDTDMVPVKSEEI